MHTAVLGIQWGDEGKGKIIDYLASSHDVIVRCQGGNNAGHTVVVNGERYPFHLLPSAILHKNKTCVLGNGMVIDPEVLLKELNNLKEKKIESANLFISNKAHIITQQHIEQDQANGKSIGTTGRGIGPAYASKITRTGLRFKEFIKQNPYHELNFIFNNVIDTSLLLQKNLDQDKKILFEGAQATMLDIDHGTYPFVTSSNCSIGGIFSGSGIFVNDINVIGVSKAYTTRVGSGPFPTELLDDMGEEIREKGHEFGTTTGRPRRCGWLDTVVLRYSKRINGLSALSIMKLDILSGLKEIKICDSYLNDTTLVTEFPPSIEELENLKANYITLPSWEEDITACKNFEELPKNAQDFITKIEYLVGIPVKYIGVGPDRTQLIVKP